MNVAIVFKWDRDPEEAQVAPDGTISWRRARYVPSDDEAAAVVFARELANATSGELIGLTVGDGDTSWALARGAQRTVSVSGVEPSHDDAAIAAALAAAVRRAGAVDVVVMGDARSRPGVAAALGALLGMPALTAADELTVDPNDQGRLLVRRRAAASVETLVARPPLLVAVGASAAEKNVPGLKEQLAARKLPAETISAADAGALPAKLVTLVASRVPEAHAARMFDGDVDAAARELVAALRADGAI